MGVYIKGMEMPTDHPLWIVVHSDGTVEANEVSASRPVGWQTLRNAAVPVPPHGRLIDADALAEVFRDFIAMYDSCPFSQLAPTDKARRDELQAALAEVINAPTIIEAEEGE